MATLLEAKQIWPWKNITPLTKQSNKKEGGEGGEGGEGEPSDDEPEDGESGQEPTPPEPDEGPRKITPDDIDENNRRVQDQMSKSKDHTPSDRPQPAQGEKSPDTSSSASGKSAGDSGGYEIDYSKIRPAFNWQTILKRFIMSASNKTEETYSKPSRRGVSGLDIMRQVGAAAIKPAEKPLEFNEAKLCFVFDVSGSMNVHNAKVFANAIQLLKQPNFKATEVAIVKFSSSFYLFKVNFARDKGQSVSSLAEKPKTWNMTAKQVVGYQVSGGTIFSAKMAEELAVVLKAKWNVIIFSDTDVLDGANYPHLSTLIKNFPRQVSVIFDSHDSYVKFRQMFGGATPLIGHF